MLKSFISIVSKHAGHVVIAGILAHLTGLGTILAAYIPQSLVTTLASIGISINPTLLATAVVAGLTNYIEQVASK